MTLTQLAELHDKICHQTTSMINADSDSLYSENHFTENQLPKPSQLVNNSLQQDYDKVNKRIAALQRHIAEKELEATRKMQEMRRFLRQEQLHLIQLSEDMVREKKRNFDFQMTIDQDPCWLNDCQADCGDLRKKFL